MMKTEKLVCVTLLGEPFRGTRDFYFGSVAAIYSLLPEERIGITYVPLCAALRRGDGYYCNKNITVRLDVMYRQPKKTTQETE